jgi:hypothetical protein
MRRALAEGREAIGVFAKGLTQVESNRPVVEVRL